jgi:HD-like signal output (HDOD) protein
MPIISSSEIFTLASLLPRLSPAAVKIVSEIDNPNTSKEQIFEFVKSDPQILAESIRQANSAAIGSFREYRTLDQVIDVMGLNHIKKVALFLSAKSMVQDKDMWFESVYCAIASHYLAMKAGLDVISADRVYMAGLFFNFGSFILKMSFPLLYSKILKADDFRDRIQLEKEEFGISSPEISALVLSRYGLPPYITEIINKQSNVYSMNDSTKENSYIEIARIFSKIQNLDIEKIYNVLDTDAIKRVVSKSGIELFNITQESLERIERQAKDLIGS